jgi:hypothetical protein
MWRVSSDQRVVGQVGLLLGKPPHLDAGDSRKAPNVEQPVELGDQPDPGKDHHRAQHDGADTEHQHALLQFGGIAKKLNSISQTKTLSIASDFSIR